MCSKDNISLSLPVGVLMKKLPAIEEKKYSYHGITKQDYDPLIHFVSHLYTAPGLSLEIIKTDCTSVPEKSPIDCILIDSDGI